MNILVTTNVLKKIIFLGFETFNVNFKVVDAIELI